MTTHYDRLGEAITARMDELGLTVSETERLTATLDAAGRGLSERTINHLRSGTEQGYRSGTIRMIERALGWGRGSVQSVLDGGSPVLDGHQDTSVQQLALEVRELRGRLDRIVRAFVGVEADV